MSDMEDEKNDILDTAKALNVGSIVPQVYNDAISPAAKEVSKSLVTVAKAINVAIKPLEGLVWGYDKIEKYIKDSLKKRFKGKSPDKIIPPPLNIAGPLVESLRFTAYQKELRELFINLLASSMDKDTSEKAHPSFVEIIKQLSPDEAKILAYISTQSNDICHHFNHAPSRNWNNRIFTEVSYLFEDICKASQVEHIELGQSYLDNMRRLLLLEYRQKYNSTRISKTGYDQYELEGSAEEYICVTSIGRQFIDTCVKPNFTSENS